jgi:hypothetical protein
MYNSIIGDECSPRAAIDNGLSMFTVSRQLYEETSSYFYQHNNISVSAPSANTDIATIIPPIADKYLRFIKRLTVHTRVGRADLPGTQKVAKSISDLAIIGANFTEVNIHIASPLSHLVNSRVDDSIMGFNHPITIAIQKLLASGITQVLRIDLKHAWFAPGVASSLQSCYSSSVEFLVDGVCTPATSPLERSLTGRHSSTHLTLLGLDERDTANDTWQCLSSPITTPISLSSALGSGFSDLDTFSVTSYEMSSDEDEVSGTAAKGEHAFFTEDDIEMWSSFTQDQLQEEQTPEETYDTDDDEEMEDVDQNEIQAILQNMEDIAHHDANDADVSYMTNFAPDLLLTRHHLDHLI